MTEERILLKMGNLKKVLYYLIICVLFFIFIYSSAKFIKSWCQLKNEEKGLEELAVLVSEAEVEEVNKSEDKVNLEKDLSSEEKNNEIKEKYRSIYEKNKDLAGWISIDGTRINYPVMQTKDDPQFYLHKNFNKEYAYSGLPFLDSFCNVLDGKLLVIYGHHMKNGTMFADLLEYEKKEFFQQHPVILFDNLYEMGEYEIFSAFYADLDAPESEFHYEYVPASENQEEINRYIESFKKKSIYETNVVPKEGEQILILSTCSYHVENGRFAVGAVKKNKE